jgi:hypothetical protein
MRDCFPVRPRPKSDESICGFVVRLAKLNGFFSIKDIFRLLELKYYAVSLETSNNRFYEFIEKLAPTLNCSPDDLLAPLTDKVESFYDPGRTVMNITSQTPKVCTDCLSTQDSYIKSSWQMVHITHCEHHQMPLIDTCRDCENKLRWDADLLEGCSKCGYRWKKVDKAPIQELPMYQLMHSRFKGDALRVYLVALYAAFEYVGNPCIFIPFQSRYSSIDTVEATSLLSQAYGLIQNSFYLTQFHRSVTSHLGKKYRFSDTPSIQKLPHNLKSLAKFPMPLPIDKHFQFELISEKSDYTSVLSVSQAASLLKISGTELTEITKQLSVPVVKIAKNNTYQLKDLAAFASLLLDRTTLADNESDTLPITMLSSVSSKFLFNYGEALRLILDKNLPLYSDKERPLFKDIFVNKNEFIKLLKNQEESQFERMLSPTDLAIYFNVNIVKIRTMAELLGWEKFWIKGGGYLYSPRAVKSFIQKFIVLDKWCNFELYGKVPLNKYLLSLGILPLVNPFDSKCKLFIYERSDSLLNAIAQFERDWHQAQPPRTLKQRFQIQKPVVLSDSATQLFQQRCNQEGIG